MKRVISIIIFVTLTVCEAFSQKVIYMERVGGVYKISCTVNGARMKMIFDTGASSVSLSKSMAEYLIENDYISKKDLLGTSNVRIADGSIVKAYRVNLKDVEIGGMHLYNVEAMISTSQYAPLLLGQSAIQKLGKISIDGNKLIINSMGSNNNSNYIQSLRNEIYNAERAGRYSVALEKLKRLKSIDNLTGNDYCWLCICYYNLRQYKECILTAQEAFNYDVITDNHERAVTLFYEADAYTALKYYREAEICLLQAKDYTNDYNDLADIYLRMGILYNNRGYYDIAINNYFTARDYAKARIGCSGKDIEKGYIQDQQLGIIFNEMRRTFNNKGDGSSALEGLKLAAQCGNLEAQRQCQRIGQSYKIRKKK